MPAAPGAPSPGPPPPTQGGGSAVFFSLPPGAVPYGSAPGYVPPPAPPPDPMPWIRVTRDGVSLYRFVVGLTLVVQVVALAAGIADASVGARLSLSAGSGSLGVAAGEGSLPSWGLGLIALSGLLGLVGLILGIVAFLRWRSGVVGLTQGVARGFGGYGAPPLPPAVAQAAHGYRSSLYVILISILAVIGGVIAVVVVVLGGLSTTVGTNGTVTSPTNAQVQAALGRAVGVIAGLVVVEIALGLLLAYFVTSSLNGFLALGPPRAAAPDRTRMRNLVLGAVALEDCGTLAVFSPYLGILSIVGAVVFLIALVEYLRAFDEALSPAFGRPLSAG